MADDVKVKFSGDFSQIAAGGASAAKTAGTALSSSFKEYTNSLASSLTSFFSVSNLMGTFFANFKGALEKFREIDEIAKQTGVSRVELQKFAKLGAEVGISMETMARSISFANKTIGAAQMHQAGATKSLLNLGFTQDQINAGTIKATDIMYKLAEAYEKNKNANTLAKQTTEVFGRAGVELTRILREGNTALRERMALMKVYSEQAVKGGARTLRDVEEGEKWLKKQFGGKQAEIFGFSRRSARLQEAELETAKQFGIDKNDVLRGDDYIGPLREKGKIKEYMDALYKNAAKRGIDPGDIAEIMTQRANERGSGIFGVDISRWQYNTNEEIIGGFARGQAAADEAARLKAGQAAEAPGLHEAVVSSLQQIGGGDIAAVMSGVTTDKVEDNTRRTAEAAEKIAGKNEAPPALLKSVTKTH